VQSRPDLDGTGKSYYAQLEKRPGGQVKLIEVCGLEPGLAGLAHAQSGHEFVRIY